MPEQLTFDLPAEPALGRGDFFVSPGNAAAVETIHAWPDWPQGKLVLVGPPGAGKTHLAHVWATLTGARIVDGRNLVETEVDSLADGPIAVEHCDSIAGAAAQEQALFHLHNLVLARGHRLLLTAAVPPARWRLTLPDLSSRVQGSAMATLGPPDDALLAAVLVKLFADRQIMIEPTVIAYLLSRMERSFAGAGRLVQELDLAALAQRRRITRALASEVLDKSGQER